MKAINITENKQEMAEIGRRIVLEKQNIYTPLMISKIQARIAEENPALSSAELEEFLYCSIYDYWVYGAMVDEELFYRLHDKSHQEKSAYMTNRLLNVYAYYLNCGENGFTSQEFRAASKDLLENKYECYKRLQPHYMRDVIEIKDENDYGVFEAFVQKHRVFIVKPSNFGFGFGVHKCDVSSYASIHDAFICILQEGIDNKKKHSSVQTAIVCEELITQADELSALHSSSINAIRIPAVIDKNHRLVILHPWIKCGVGGAFIATAAFGGFDAEIDPDTGIVISNGYSENGSVYEIHPDTHIVINGFQIPKWDDLKTFVQELMQELPEYRYISWDFALTPKGWVVVEANYSGEFMWQLIRQCGGKQEFEDIIGWKMEADFWWQILPYEALV